MMKQKHHIHWVSSADCKDADMNGGISTADPLQYDSNPRYNSPSHHTLILPVISGSAAATSDTLI